MREQSLRRHKGLSNPIGSLTRRKKPVLCFIDSSPGVRRQSGGWVSHFSRNVWTESCIPVFKVSLQTRPTADINKVIRWARRDSEGNSVLGALEEPSDSTFWQFRLSCFIVLWGKKDVVWLWMLPQSLCTRQWRVLFCIIVHVNENLCFAKRWCTNSFAYWGEINLNLYSYCFAL